MGILTMCVCSSLCVFVLLHVRVLLLLVFVCDLSCCPPAAHFNTSQPLNYNILLSLGSDPVIIRAAGGHQHLSVEIGRAHV